MTKMKKYLLFLGVVCVLLGCTKNNPEEPQKPVEQTFSGDYNTTTTGKIFLEDSVASPLTPDSISIPGFAQNMVIERATDTTVTITFQDTVQEPFSAVIIKDTIYYNAPLAMKMSGMTMTGTRIGIGTLESNTILTMEETVKGTFFGTIVYSGFPIVLKGNFHGTLKYVGTKK